MQSLLHKCERGRTALFTVLSGIYLFASRIVHLLFFLPSAISSLVTYRRADPSSYRRKIALMSDRKWQTRGGQRKRKKLVSKGKLISSHFVSTRSQPSSALSLPFYCIGYFRFFVHYSFSRASNPVRWPNYREKVGNDRVCICSKKNERLCARSFAILNANETRYQWSFKGFHRSLSITAVNGGSLETVRSYFYKLLDNDISE